MHTIGMACFDNADEVFFTVQSLRIHHAAEMSRVEIVVVDNNPGSIDGNAVKSFIEGRVRSPDCPRGRYVPFPSPRGSCPPRQYLFDVARGDWVCCIDSHVLLESGALKRLLDYFDAHPGGDDLLHGPLVSNFGPHRLEATHMKPVWRSEMFGTWAVDPAGKNPGNPPFEIPMHGLGLFAARRESWLGFHPDCDGFSGGEGYIHEKYRQAGRRVLCLPGVRWLHKFQRPHGIPHRPRIADKIRNHARGWRELGVDLATGETGDPIRSMSRHYVPDRMPAAQFEAIVATAGFPGYSCDTATATRGLIVGPREYGSYKMRGAPVARRFGFEEFDARRPRRVRPSGRYAIGVALKCPAPETVRRHCDRVVFEPLDLWFGDRGSGNMRPGDWLKRQHNAAPFDDLIASTLPMAEAGERRLPRSVRVHFVPHHADPRVGLDWYDAAGPIVYAGHRDFVAGHRDTIREAGRMIGRDVVLDTSVNAWRALRGAALVLAPRLRSRSRLNLEGKPTVKLANAAQAGIPALATPDPASAELFFDVRTAAAADWANPVTLAGHLDAALSDKPSDVKFPEIRWLERMAEILGTGGEK